MLRCFRRLSTGSSQSFTHREGVQNSGVFPTGDAYGKTLTNLMHNLLAASVGLRPPLEVKASRGRCLAPLLSFLSERERVFFLLIYS